MKNIVKILIISFFVVSIGCGLDITEDIEFEIDQLPPTIDFNVHVKPILSDKCFACHGPDQNTVEADLRLDIESIAKSSGHTKSGKPAIVEGRLNRSELIHRIITADENEVMPPPESNLSLTNKEKALLIKWVDTGAEYQPHWAFSSLEKPALPDIIDVEVANEIDNFIAEKLLNSGLGFNAEADRSLLLRRLSFDLIGLPPTLSEISDFKADIDSNAYEKQIDRLLSSSHFGERMAVDWMDVARFADTHGYQSDRFRDMSPWRDWVIKSFNENLPYDTFITWQLAGDLFDDPTHDQSLATAFLRLHPQNEEGGIIEEEFKVEYVTDRVNTVGTAFMGLTVGCAKCHDHKYDPISQREYFELYSFFNNVNEAGQISFNGAMPVPTMLLTDEKTDSIITFIKSEIKENEIELLDIEEDLKSEFENWISAKSYKQISSGHLSNLPIAHFSLDNHLKNEIGKTVFGEMKRTSSNDETPVFTMGQFSKSLLLNGDAWLDLNVVGNFKRYDPFTICLWINIPEDITDGVIFHKGSGAALFNFKGFHIALKNNQLELLMAAVAPNNAIIEIVNDPIPREEWIQLTLRYDGKSSAKGFSLFMNGMEKETTVKIDNLYKDITVYNGADPVGLQFGARWRGKGIGGAKIDDIQVFDLALSKLEILKIANWEAWNNIVSKDKLDLSPVDLNLLREYFDMIQPAFKIKNEQLVQLQKSLSDTIEPIKEIMVMEEMAVPRQSYILDRGQYDSPTEAVYPNTPESILEFQSDYPKNRLGLAKWLTDPEHPLTARVAVNRYWQLIFGEGLVKTSEDFGNQGSLPKNKELLDYLAFYFIDSGWNVKSLLKKMLMSKTYRQSSIPSEKSNDIDPDNSLFSRGPSARLNAEMLRDNMLIASQLINDSIGGSSVFPYQPEGLWGMLAGGKYPKQTKKDKYRRSLYTFWKRTVPHPTQATFDAPERSECMVRRQETNTPLQALALMNDRVYIEAAQKIALDIVEESSLSQAFLSLTGRTPTDVECELLNKMYTQELNKFESEPEKISSWLTDLNTGSQNKASLASYAVVVSTIMNTDACIMKR